MGPDRMNHFPSSFHKERINETNLTIESMGLDIKFNPKPLRKVSRRGVEALEHLGKCTVLLDEDLSLLLPLSLFHCFMIPFPIPPFSAKFFPCIDIVCGRLLEEQKVKC